MGFGAAFPYESAADIFREHAALSAFENGGRRDFDIGAWPRSATPQFDALDPVQWPVRADEPKRTDNRPDERFFSTGGFYTADRKARFIAPDAEVAGEQRIPVPSQHRTRTRSVAYDDPIGSARGSGRICPSRSSRCIRTMRRQRVLSTAALPS